MGDRLGAGELPLRGRVHQERSQGGTSRDAGLGRGDRRGLGSLVLPDRGRHHARVGQPSSDAFGSVNALTGQERTTVSLLD